jgi:hypothetical protein
MVIDDEGVYEDPALPINEPPDEAVYHPLKVYPLLLGVGRVTELPAFTASEAGLTVPPFAL